MEGLLGRFLSFDKMMAGTIVKVLYYIGIALILILGVWRFFASLFGGDFTHALWALIGIPIALLFARVFAEMFIVTFRISDNLAALRKLKEAETGDALSP